MTNKVFACLLSLMGFAMSLLHAQGSSDSLSMRLSPYFVTSGESFTPNLVFDGWLYGCPPILVRESFDATKKLITVDLLDTFVPCSAPSATFTIALAPRQLPQGRYEVLVREGNSLFEIESGSTTRLRAALTVSAKVGNDVFIGSQNLLLNPGVADAEQFMQITVLQSCPSIAFTPSITRRAGALDVRLDVERVGVICPGLLPGPSPFARLVSLGKLPAGTYDVTVSVVDKSATAVILKERLVLSDSGGVPATSTGVWYDPAESGWGMTIFESNNVAFVTWYVSLDKRPFWYVMSRGVRDGAVIRGNIYSTSGATDFRFNWNPVEQRISQLGEAVITFRNEANASVTSIFAGVPVTRNVTRIAF